jgi:hypothetical protein
MNTDGKGASFKFFVEIFSVWSITTRSKEAEQERIAYLEKEIQTKERGPRRTDGGARRAKKRDWGTLTGVWVPHDRRDQGVDFVLTYIRNGYSIGAWRRRTRRKLH